MGARLARNGARPGIALLNALLFTALVTSLLIVAIKFTSASMKVGRTDKYHAQAYHMARAGLTDTVNWFKRQPSQPVASFVPLPNPSTPAHGDTNDPYNIDPGAAGGGTSGHKGEPNLGIVQEYQLDGTLYGRYEVGKIAQLQRDSHGRLADYELMEPGSGNDLSPVPIANASNHDYEGVQDRSTAEGLSGTGQAWRLRSHGYVYRREVPNPTPSTLFFELPNEVLDQVELETEIQRLTLNDYHAALTGYDSGDMDFNNSTSVKVVGGGSGYAVVYTTGSGPTVYSSYTGSPSSTHKNTGNSVDWPEVFSVSSGSAFAGLADYVESSVSALPDKMSTMAVTYIKPSGTATFTSARPLQGGGILAVDGDMTIAAGSNSSFTGLIYVSGDLTINSPCTLAGEVVCRGKITLNSSSASQPTAINYDQTILNDAATQLGQYRESRSALRVVS